VTRRLAALLPFILVAACTSAPNDTPTSDDGSRSPAASAGASGDGILVIQDGAVADGPGISVQEALDYTGGAEVLVNGSLVIDPDGVVLLCDALAESFPPQCGGARLEVRGLDPAGQPDLQEANGVRWLDRIQLFGTVERAD
jgi:hypothetical protein